MGYTNYWNFKKNVTINSNMNKRYELAKNEINDLLNYVQMNNIVKIKNDSDHLIINFNGDPTTNNDHENFVLLDTLQENVNDWSFCKTARKPYDKVVISSLFILKEHLYNFVNISSDGYSNTKTHKYCDDEIHEGYKLYKNYKKYRSVNPIVLTLKQLFE